MKSQKGMYPTSFEQEIVNLIHKNGSQSYICKQADFSQLKKVIHYELIMTIKNKFVQALKGNFVLTGDLRAISDTP